MPDYTFAGTTKPHGLMSAVPWDMHSDLLSQARRATLVMSDRYAAWYRDAFDAVYGSSAGAINATYFLSGQRDGVRIYTEEIANKDFIDMGRLININRKTQGEQL